jgi:hypothetical protein
LLVAGWIAAAEKKKKKVKNEITGPASVSKTVHGMACIQTQILASFRKLYL